MNLYAGAAGSIEGGHRMVHGHRGSAGPAGHIPPHERRGMVHIEYDEEDLEVLTEVFGDGDTAAAAAEVILGAPPEIQVLAFQAVDLIKEVRR